MTEESWKEDAQMIGEVTQGSVISGCTKAPLIIDLNQAWTTSGRRCLPGYLDYWDLASVLKYQVIL